MDQSQPEPQLKEHKEMLLSFPELSCHGAEGHLSSGHLLPFLNFNS